MTGKFSDNKLLGSEVTGGEECDMGHDSHGTRDLPTSVSHLLLFLARVLAWTLSDMDGSASSPLWLGTNRDSGATNAELATSVMFVPPLRPPLPAGRTAPIAREGCHELRPTTMRPVHPAFPMRRLSRLQ